MAMIKESDTCIVMLVLRHLAPGRRRFHIALKGEHRLRLRVIIEILYKTKMEIRT